MVPVRIILSVLASDMVQHPLANSIRHPALLNLEMERRDMFDEGTSIAFLSKILFTEPLSPDDFVQIVAVPRPEDETDPSPNPVILFVSSLLRKLKLDRFVRMCDVVPELIIIGVGPLAKYAWDILEDFDESAGET